MRRVIRIGLAFAAGGLALLALDAIARRRGAGAGLIARRLLDVLRPLPVSDDTVETRVRNKLARTASEPGAITVSIEHGCVDLRGAVPTQERARIVRAIATVRGVDSVLDLMKEPSPTAFTLSAAAQLGHPRAAHRHPAGFRRAVWPPAGRILAAGIGLGLTTAGLRIGGLFALPAATVGLLLIAAAASATSRQVPAAAGEQARTTKVKPRRALDPRPAPREGLAAF